MIYPPSHLEEHQDIKVVVAGRYFMEMSEDAAKRGIKNICSFEAMLKEYTFLPDANILNKERTIELGKFLEGESEIVLKNLTFIPGGSQVLDYAFLRSLIKKFELKNYLEVGTYIGESIHVVADLCEVCHSITAPLESDYSMRNWCIHYNRPDYSERLAFDENIVHHYCDSKTFNYKSIKESIDLFFIDGDHSYNGVFCDTCNIFSNRKKDSFVVWHDFKNVYGFNSEVITAVKNALKDEFSNVFVIDNNICGVYIPKQYQNMFVLKEFGYKKIREKLYTYDTVISVNAVD